MRKVLRIIGVFVGWVAIISTSAAAWEKAEHRRLADSAFVRVLRDCQVPESDVLVLIFNAEFSMKLSKKFWLNQDFGELCASFSHGDHSRARFQERGRSILQQLKPLSSKIINEAWSECDRKNLPNSEPMASVGRPKDNVIVNYLEHHLIALRYAHRAGANKSGSDDALRNALVYEAMAQTYLADAFSSGHLLVPLNDPFYRLHPRNNQEAHDFYCQEGIFVMNSRGEIWQAFGDKLLNWYAPSYEHVLEACVSSLRELFLILYVSAGREPPGTLKKWGESISIQQPGRLADSWLSLRNGKEYYELAQMPTLLLLPMPVSAAWSVKNAQDNNPRNNHRRYFPQLFDEGLHDPELDQACKKSLYRKEDVPNWLVPEWMLRRTPQKLIKENPDFASVRYIQHNDFPPSFAGFLFSSGGGVVLKRKGTGPAFSLGLGYGLVDDLLFLKKVSVDALLLPRLDEPTRFLIGSSMGFGIKLPLQHNPLEAFHFEQGYVWGLRSPYKSSGLKFAIGLDSKTIPLGFTYAGVTARLKYEWLWLERTKQAVIAEVILH